MTFVPQFATNTCLHSESIWINLQVSIFCAFMKTKEHIQKTENLKQLGLNICNVDAFFFKTWGP